MTSGILLLTSRNTAGALLFYLLTAISNTALATNQPNILWMVAEDMSPYLSAYGDHTAVATPNLDRLAREGITYTKVFSVSGVCSPSRAALATGVYPTRIGAQNMNIGNASGLQKNDPKAAAFFRQFMPPDIAPYEVVPPPEVRMHAEYLRAAGYYTSNNAKEDYQFQTSFVAWDDSSASAHWRNRPEGKPFFAVFNFEVTHEAQIWNKADDPLLVSNRLQVTPPPYLPDTEVVRRDMRRMYSNIVEMDRQVGHLLKQLEDDGLLENTIIFWYSDHGGPLPRQKRLVYDSGLQVPMFVRLPQQKQAGSDVDDLISFVDFAPTLLSLAGIKPPDYMDGKAFLGKFRYAYPRHYIHAAADRFDEERDTIRAVRDTRFKYIRNFHPDQPYYLPLSFREKMGSMQELLRLHNAGKLNAVQRQWFRKTKDTEELFDTINDPHELHNLAQDANYKDKLEELRGELNRWIAESSDKGFIQEQKLIESFWPQGVRPQTASPSIYVDDDLVSIESEEPGASLGYRLIGVNGPITHGWKIYTTPFRIGSGIKVEAQAHRLGYAMSSPASWPATKSNPGTTN